MVCGLLVLRQHCESACPFPLNEELIIHLPMADKGWRIEEEVYLYTLDCEIFSGVSKSGIK